MRVLWVILAWTALALAALGVVLPGLPTTPFVLVAAWAAAKGSRSLHAWLLAHRLFGPMIRDWQAHGAVSRRAKRSAVGMMALCAVLMVLTAPKLAYAAVGSACMAVVAVWLWRRPEPPPAQAPVAATPDDAGPPAAG
jgi:uncharacterized membrane protein YbaN (DUF454 family)